MIAATAALDGAEVADDAEGRVGAGILHGNVGDGFRQTENLKWKRRSEECTSL